MSKERVIAQHGRGGNGRERDRVLDSAFAPEIELTKLYLEDIGWVPILSREEEIELAKRIEEGRAAGFRLASEVDSSRYQGLLTSVEEGISARQKLITSHTKLVVSIAAKRLGEGSLSLDDLIQEGNIGLIRATGRYNYRKGRFCVYAGWWIKQSIGRAQRDKGRTVRISYHMSRSIFRMRNAEVDLLQTLRREPTDGELAERLGVEVEKVRLMKSTYLPMLSLDLDKESEYEKQGKKALMESVSDPSSPSPEEELERATLKRDASRAMYRNLSPREIEILLGRHRDGLTYQQVGEKLGVSRETVRKDEFVALQKIRTSAASDPRIAELAYFLHT